jgi:3,4-dihydroxy 2-butanone 4-phosphate synthase/GTP cyclohydrolase II
MANQILVHFGIDDLRLLTNNPDKLDALKGFGNRRIVREKLSIPANGNNHHYLLTKCRKFGHQIEIPPAIESMS